MVGFCTVWTVPTSFSILSFASSSSWYSLASELDPVGGSRTTHTSACLLQHHVDRAEHQAHALSCCSMEAPMHSMTEVARTRVSVFRARGYNKGKQLASQLLSCGGSSDLGVAVPPPPAFPDQGSSKNSFFVPIPNNPVNIWLGQAQIHLDPSIHRLTDGLSLTLQNRRRFPVVGLN